jgi:hypothetical protein
MKHAASRLSEKIRSAEKQSGAPISSCGNKGQQKIAFDNRLCNKIRTVCEPNLGYIILN